MTYLSGYFLELDGWLKSGFVWTKRLDTIKYNGTNWELCELPKDMSFSEEEGVVFNWRKIDFIEEIKIL